MKFEAEGASAYVLILLLCAGGLGLYQVASMFTPLPGIDQMLGFNLDGAVDPDWAQPEGTPDDSHRVNVELSVAEQDTETVVTGVAYIWYDADDDGIVDIGEDGMGSEGSEVESVTLTSDGGTSQRSYWTGTTIGVQHHGTGMYPGYTTRTVPDMGVYDTSVGVDKIYAVDVYTSATATASDQGSNALDTSTDYNSTTSGLTLTMTIRLGITAGGEGFGANAYTDWDTGYAYVGPFLDIILDNTDTDLVFDASTYDTRVESGAYIHYIIQLAPFFNDADLTSDGFISITVVIDILGDGDFDVNFYDTLRTDNFNAFSFGSADASISDIDIIS